MPALGPQFVRDCFKRTPSCGLRRSPPLAKAIAGRVLTEERLLALVDGFKGTALFPIVAVAAFTGARRNEILALRWVDLDIEKRTLKIARAIEETKNEETKKYGIAFKGPKTERGKRTIAVDDDLIAMLCAERDKHLRIMVGVSDGTAVDLSLVKLPAGALMFPNPPASGELFSFNKPRNPREHDERIYAQGQQARVRTFAICTISAARTDALSNKGIPVHVVAARCGHDPQCCYANVCKEQSTSPTSEQPQRSANCRRVSCSVNVFGSKLGVETLWVARLFRARLRG